MAVSDSDHNLRKRATLVRPPHINRPTGMVTALIAVGALLAGATGCSAGLGGPASSRAARDGVIRFFDLMRQTHVIEDGVQDPRLLPSEGNDS